MLLSCEVGTLADAVNKAARIAPMKGPEFVRAAGILLELRPGDFSNHELILKSTDLEVAYRQVVPVLEMDGEDTDWRLPSGLLAGILSTLPMGAGQTVTLEQHENSVRIKSGRSKATLRLMDAANFPVMPYTVKGTPLEIDDFARLLGQVSWACASDKPPVSGVHIDGERLIGLDGKKIAIVPCKITVDAPITVPLSSLAALIKNTSRVGLIAHQNRLYLLPDDETQASTVIFAAEYPKVDNALRTDFSHRCGFLKADLEQAVSRMLVLVKGEKFPLVRLVIGPATVGVQMDVPEIGLMEDEIDLTSCTLGAEETFDIWFTPADLLGAMSAASKPELEFQFGPASLQSISITDDTGYRCDVMPRHVISGQAAAVKP